MGSQLGAVNSIYQQQAGYPTFDTAELINRYMQDTLQMANQSFLKHWVDHPGADVEWFLSCARAWRSSSPVPWCQKAA